MDDTLFDLPQERRGIGLVLTGGEVPGAGLALTGTVAQNALKGLRADRLLLTVAGISSEFGLAHAELAEASIKMAMVRAAREVAVLVDHSTSAGLDAQVAGFGVVHRIVVDAALPAEQHRALSGGRIDVIIAPTHQPRPDDGVRASKET